MEMGEKIYNLRIEKGLTLEELGNLVGVGKSTVRKWEKGMISNMKRDKIAKLASALDTTPAYLMGWEEEIDRSDEDKPFYFDDETAEIAHDMYFNARSILKVYKSEDKDKLIEYADTLLLARRFRSVKVNAAHERTDIEVTNEMKEHDDAFFDEED